MPAPSKAELPAPLSWSLPHQVITTPQRQMESTLLGCRDRSLNIAALEHWGKTIRHRRNPHPSGYRRLVNVEWSVRSLSYVVSQPPRTRRLRACADAISSGVRPDHLATPADLWGGRTCVSRETVRWRSVSTLACGDDPLRCVGRANRRQAIPAPPPDIQASRADHGGGHASRARPHSAGAATAKCSPASRDHSGCTCRTGELDLVSKARATGAWVRTSGRAGGSRAATAAVTCRRSGILGPRCSPVDVDTGTSVMKDGSRSPGPWVRPAGIRPRMSRGAVTG